MTTYRVTTKRSVLLRDCYASIPGWGDCALVIKRGFEYDGPTLPREALPFIAHRDLSALAPLVHDFIYDKQGQVQTLQGSWLNLTRAEADEIFHRIMLQQGVTPWKAHVAYLACRLFGGRWWGNIWAKPNPLKWVGRQGYRFVYQVGLLVLWLLSKPTRLARQLKARLWDGPDRFPSTTIRTRSLGKHVDDHE